MLQYLIILLNNTSVSFCHYKNRYTTSEMIPEKILKEGILFGMKHNLMIQFVYPQIALPDTLQQIIETVDHIKIIPYQSPYNRDADILVLQSPSELEASYLPNNKNCILTTHVDNSSINQLKTTFKTIRQTFQRINIITDNDMYLVSDSFIQYKSELDQLKSNIIESYLEDFPIQINILTDRMFLDEMNNCNAGVNTITLAPDGKYYICPAFYNDIHPTACGDLGNGINIPNANLYSLPYAPLCRQCDAYHCKRCVWLNKEKTLEVNTPSQEQCIMAHIERNKSRELLTELQRYGEFLPGKQIPEIDYLDPFDKK